MAIILAHILFLAGCTSISVKPLQVAEAPKHICVKRNPKVLVVDFVDVLRLGIKRHNMTSEVFGGARPEHCSLILTYTALRSWDFTPYLAKAELWLRQDLKQVGYANYRLIGGGGFSLFKWQGTATKMDPVIDQLFSEL